MIKSTFGNIFLGERGLLFKNKIHKSVKTLKMAENKQSILIACLKMLKIAFIEKYIRSEMGEGGYLVSDNYQSLLSYPDRSISLPSKLSFSIKYRRNRFLLVTFIEL